MGTHLIPREVEGEGRILIIFTMQGFVGTLIGIGIGTIFYSLFSSYAPAVAWILLVVCAIIGFIIGQVKIPNSNAFDILKKTGGYYVREAIAKYFRFRKQRKIYTYDKGGGK